MIQRFATTSTPMTAALLAAALSLVYLLTATTGGNQVNDTYATALAAHRLATHGDLTLDDYGITSEELPWLKEVDGRLVSNRFPGAIFAGVPFYALVGRAEFSPVPAALASATLTALAMAVLYLVLRRVTPAGPALVATGIAALATPTWTVSADALWTHGPGQLWLAIAMLGLATERYAGSGLGFAAGLFTRPQTGVFAAVAGLVESWQRRSVAPAVQVGLTTSVGLVALLVYNATAFGSVSATGGYGSRPIERAASMSAVDYLVNLAGALVSPSRGLLVYSLFLVPLLWGLRAGWRHAPSWVRSCAVAGVAYFLVQMRANGFDGGYNVFGYRLPLEALTAATPLLALSYVHGIDRRPWLRRIFWGAVGAASMLHAVAAVAYVRQTILWESVWYPGELTALAAEVGPVLLWGLVLAGALAGLWASGSSLGRASQAT